MTIPSFQYVLTRLEGLCTWTYLNIPAAISAAFGSRGQVRVKGTSNGYPSHTTALPMGDGSHYLLVRKDIRDWINAAQGDVVEVNRDPA